MRWYVASRVRHQQALRQVATFLDGVGETWCADWIYEENLQPYSQHRDQVRIVAEQVTTAVSGCDVFVLISDPAGTDMFVELGIMLGAHQQDPRKRIYIVGPYAERSLMQLHPAIMHAVDIAAVFSREGVTTNGFVTPDFSY